MKPPNRTWQALGVIAAIALAIVVCLTVPGPGKRPENLFKKPKKAPEEIAEITRNAPTLPFELTEGRAEFGDPEAPVKLTVFIPGAEACGNETAIFARSVAEANKDKLHTEVVDFNHEEGARYQQELGTSCSGLMINGKQLVQLVDETGNKKTLDFTMNLGESYQEEDVFLALDHEFEQAYGEKCKRVGPEPTDMTEADSQEATEIEEADGSSD